MVFIEPYSQHTIIGHPLVESGSLVVPVVSGAVLLARIVSIVSRHISVVVRSYFSVSVFILAFGIPMQI